MEHGLMGCVEGEAVSGEVEAMECVWTGHGCARAMIL